jgi:hypothetical protein
MLWVGLEVIRCGLLGCWSEGWWSSNVSLSNWFGRIMLKFRSVSQRSFPFPRHAEFTQRDFQRPLPTCNREVLPIPHFRTSASEMGNFTFRDTKKSTTWFATWFNVAQWRHPASNFGPGLGPAGFRAVLGLVPLEATW